MSQVPWCDYNPVTVVKITLDYDASGVPHNTLADPCAWSCTPYCFWFSDCQVGPLIAAAAAATNNSSVRPIISSFNTSGQRLAVGRSMSERGTVAMCLLDELIDCTDPCSGGSVSEWIVNQKWWGNRLMEVWYGDCDQDLADMEKETYLIESATPAGSNCQACIVARDPLVLLSGSSNSVPAPCPLTLTLRPNLWAEFEVNEDTGEVIKDPYSEINRFILTSNIDPADPNLSCLICAQHVCVNGEILRVAPVINDAGLLSPDNAFGPAGYNLVLLERGACGTERRDIQAGSVLQPAESIEQCHVADYLVEIIQERSNFEDSALTCCTSAPVVGLDCQSIEDFRCKHPLNIIDESVICPSVSVQEILDDLALENLLAIYYDNAAGGLVVSAICPAPPTGADVVLEECQIVEGSLVYRPGTETYNRIVIGYNPNDWTAGTSDDNYSVVAEDGDPDFLYNDQVVLPCERRKNRAERVFRHNSRFMGRCGRHRAETLASQLCTIYACPNDELTVQVHPNSACDIPLGTTFEINHSKLSPIQRTQQWTLVSRARKGKRNWCVELTFEQIFPTGQPIALGFDCAGTPPADNLSNADVSACDSTCLVML
jgi:hypothetical protein